MMMKTMTIGSVVILLLMATGIGIVMNLNDEKTPPPEIVYVSLEDWSVAHQFNNVSGMGIGMSNTWNVTPTQPTILNFSLMAYFEKVGGTNLTLLDGDEEIEQWNNTSYFSDSYVFVPRSDNITLRILSEGSDHYPDSLFADYFVLKVEISQQVQ